jgi:putative DNA primase/helicase
MIKNKKDVNKSMSQNHNFSISKRNDEVNMKKHLEMYINQFDFSIVPANTREKKGTYFSWKKYQKEKATISEAKKWLEEYPQMGLAIVTGQISDIIVLDIDPRHGGYETIAQRECPDTLTVKTGGGGKHYYYQYPDIDGVDRISNFTGDNVDLPGVDLRADGGMAYAPPSVHPSDDYYSFVDQNQEINPPPQWLIDLIKEGNTTVDKLSSSSQTKKEIDWDDKWSGAKEGNRNNVCAQLAGKLASSGIPIEEAKSILLDTWNPKNVDGNGDPNLLPEKEISKTVENIYKKDNQSSSKNKESKNNDFIPSEIAEEVLETEEDDDCYWRYVLETEEFYHYSQADGYWKPKEEGYLQYEIRETIKQINKTWERNYKIKEVLSALKHNLLDSKNNSIFNDLTQLEEKHLNVKNGMLEWDTMTLKPHSPDYFSLFQFPIEFDSKATCPLWKSTMEDWIDSKKTIKFLQEFIGYCLIPDTSYQVALLIVGSGSNGKSTFLEILEKMFGSKNLTNIPLNKISQRFETAYLHQTLVNICSDIDPTYLKKTGVVKTMISGEKLRGEEKYGDSFDFSSIVRLIFSTNELPRTKDKTEGWYRRFKIVRFPNQFSPTDSNYDPKLKRKLIKELPGIFNWAIEGLKRLKDQGYFTISDEMKREKINYKCNNDSVRAFAEAKLKKTNEDKKQYQLPKQYLYDEYKKYCEKVGLSGVVTRKKFTKRLKELDFEEGRRRFKVSKTTESYLDGRSDGFYNNVEGIESKSMRCFIRIKYENIDQSRKNKKKKETKSNKLSKL